MSPVMVAPTLGAWLRTGDEAFAAMLDAIGRAQTAIRLESYIYRADEVGDRFRDALLEARHRGVAVQVLVDSWGSMELSEDYWIPLRSAGAECRWFNPFHLERFGFRDHRKLLVCDEGVAFVGGFNLAAEYAGDGVTRGWFDLGLRVEHPDAARALAESFDMLFANADFRHRRFARWRRPRLAPAAASTLSSPRAVAARAAWLAGLSSERCALLLNGPGIGFNSFKRALVHDLRHAGSVRIMTAYFLPTFRIRRELLRLARMGRRVQLIFAGRSDVPLAQRACQRLYSRLLKAGIEIFEYQPQMLHAKLILLDGLFYIGSSNLDVRSLNINYELMLRVRNPALAAEAAEIFEQARGHSRRVELAAWKKGRSLWARFLERWSHFVLARLDPLFIRWQMRRLR